MGVLSFAFPAVGTTSRTESVSGKKRLGCSGGSQMEGHLRGGGAASNPLRETYGLLFSEDDGHCPPFLARILSLVLWWARRSFAPEPRRMPHRRRCCRWQSRYRSPRLARLCAASGMDGVGGGDGIGDSGGVVSWPTGRVNPVGKHVTSVSPTLW